MDQETRKWKLKEDSGVNQCDADNHTYLAEIDKSNLFYYSYYIQEVNLKHIITATVHPLCAVVNTHTQPKLERLRSHK